MARWSPWQVTSTLSRRVDLRTAVGVGHAPRFGSNGLVDAELEVLKTWNDSPKDTALFARGVN